MGPDPDTPAAAAAAASNPPSGAKTAREGTPDRAAEYAEGPCAHPLVEGGHEFCGIPFGPDKRHLALHALLTEAGAFGVLHRGGECLHPMADRATAERQRVFGESYAGARRRGPVPIAEGCAGPFLAYCDGQTRERISRMARETMRSWGVRRLVAVDEGEAEPPTVERQTVPTRAMDDVYLAAMESAPTELKRHLLAYRESCAYRNVVGFAGNPPCALGRRRAAARAVESFSRGRAGTKRKASEPSATASRGPPRMTKRRTRRPPAGSGTRRRPPSGPVATVAKCLGEHDDVPVVVDGDGDDGARFDPSLLVDTVWHVDGDGRWRESTNRPSAANETGEEIPGPRAAARNDSLEAVDDDDVGILTREDASDTDGGPCRVRDDPPCKGYLQHRGEGLGCADGEKADEHNDEDRTDEEKESDSMPESSVSGRDARPPACVAHAAGESASSPPVRSVTDGAAPLCSLGGPSDTAPTEDILAHSGVDDEPDGETRCASGQATRTDDRTSDVPSGGPTAGVAWPMYLVAQAVGERERLYNAVLIESTVGAWASPGRSVCVYHQMGPAYWAKRFELRPQEDPAAPWLVFTPIHLDPVQHLWESLRYRLSVLIEQEPRVAIHFPDQGGASAGTCVTMADSWLFKQAHALTALMGSPECLVLSNVDAEPLVVTTCTMANYVRERLMRISVCAKDTAIEGHCASLMGVFAMADDRPH